MGDKGEWKRSIAVRALLGCGTGLAVGLLAGSTIARAAVRAPDSNDPIRVADDRSAGEKPDNREIVVVGTLVRGQAPVGTEVLSLPHAEIEATGASTTAQLMQSIPQLASFNSLLFPVASINQVTSNRPNLRNFDINLTGSSTTLVLLDGHRLVGMGVQLTTADPDILPPGMIERIDIATEGGSAIYGSDAVAGVMNFVTRKNIKGIELDGHYGFAADYQTLDATASAGREWDGGSAFISAYYAKHDAIYGRDRDYVREPAANIAGIPFPVTAFHCTPGNVQILPSGTVFALPYTSQTAKPNTANQCDVTDDRAIYPREHRYAVFAGLAQQLSGAVNLDVRGYFADRWTYEPFGPNFRNLIVGPALFGLPVDSPFRLTHLVSGNPFEVHQVYLAFGDNEASSLRLQSRSWGVTPSIFADIGSGWQLRAFANFGESTTEAHTRMAALIPFNNAINTGLFNPYEPAASDPTALAAIQNSEIFGKTRQRLYNGRVVADGNLLSLPAGPVKLALGSEFLREELRSQKGTIVPGFQDSGYPGLSLPVAGRPPALIQPPLAPLPIVPLARTIWAAFGELVIPVFGNGGPGLEQLTLSASGRYDHYSDWGDTFNPKLAIDYRPLAWVRLRGAWGKAFVAPSLADDARVNLATLGFGTGIILAMPPPELIANGSFPAPRPGQNTVAIILGSAPGLQPQKATTLSLGADLEPPFLPGASLEVSYWKIDYSDGIRIPPFLFPRIFWTRFTSLITVNPTQAQLDAAYAIASSIQGSPCAPQPACVYAILDARKRNYAVTKLDGLDIVAHYKRATSFGSINLAVNATYALHNWIAFGPGVAADDLLNANMNRFQLRASLGAQVGNNLQVAVNLNHSGGYELNPPVGAAPQQTEVGSFDVVSLFARYDFKTGGAFENLSLSLSVDNLFDQDPPEYRQNDITAPGLGFANGATLGRLVQFGVSKRF
jgi:iron complex outermembrane receptor protein